MKDKKTYIICAIVFLIGIALIVIATTDILIKDKEPNNPDTPDIPIVVDGNNDFDFKMIKQTQKYYKENYMISPLSIAYAFTILKEGAKENSLKELEDVLGKYSLPKSFAIKDKISIANLLFINNIYKSDIKTDYIKTIQNTYGSDLLFDDMKSPDKINEWISKKTFKMIPNAISEINPDVVLGIANAIAIDVEWKNKLECKDTYGKDFTKENGETYRASTMHGGNDVAYIENDNAKGIIKDYAIYDKNTGKIVEKESDNTIALEYIAILPNTSIDEYINNFSKVELNSLLKNQTVSDDNTDIYYSLPKYSYDFNYLSIKSALKELGLNDIFTGNSNLRGIADLDLYVSEVIHKSHIELSENGTKAAAVTVIMMMENAAFIEEQKRIININFDKPFIYIIKEKNSDNIWFFGTVYEPMKIEEDTYCTRK